MLLAMLLVLSCASGCALTQGATGTTDKPDSTEVTEPADDSYEVPESVKDNTTCEAALDDYAQAQLAGDSQAIADLMPPGFLEGVKQTRIEWHDYDEDRAQKLCDSICMPVVRSLDMAPTSEWYENPFVAVDCEIRDEYIATADETAELAARLKNDFLVKGNIEGCALVEYRLVLTAEKGNEFSRVGNAICVQVDGLWYFINNLGTGTPVAEIYELAEGLQMKEIYIQWMHERMHNW